MTPWHLCGVSVLPWVQFCPGLCPALGSVKDHKGVSCQLTLTCERLHDCQDVLEL